MNIRTCGIDVFNGYIEYVILDWMNEELKGKIATGIIHGDFKNQDMQKRLKKLLKLFKVDVAAIDGGGYKIQYVYDFCLKYKEVFPIKGVKMSTHKNFNKDDMSVIKPKADDNDFIYGGDFVIAKYKIVNLNLMDIEANDVFALAVMGKDIASLK